MDTKFYNSSIVMFHGIKNSIKRASNYSKGTLMLDMIKVVKKVLRYYAECFIERARKNNDNFELNACWTINTAEYCKKMMEGVE